ncbi:DUF397 domain-containing protein [Dactylosporangium sp. NPDC051541]|uniref:DUF397 domain-containing protein n=1 Tax=Dactylosporangium sp. NPDC051541 TaxID=3363977 RepID=UPI00378AA2B4
MSPDRSWHRACVSEHNCVEVSFIGPLVRVRSSNLPAAVVAFSAADWRSFVTSVKEGTLGHAVRHGFVAAGGRSVLDRP